MLRFEASQLCQSKRGRHPGQPQLPAGGAQADPGESGARERFLLREAGGHRAGGGGRRLSGYQDPPGRQGNSLPS